MRCLNTVLMLTLMLKMFLGERGRGLSEYNDDNAAKFKFILSTSLHTHLIHRDLD